MHAIHVSLYTIIFLVALALIFDFMNGFHDAANAIATVVSTGVIETAYSGGHDRIHECCRYFRV